MPKDFLKNLGKLEKLEKTLDKKHYAFEFWCGMLPESDSDSDWAVFG